MPTLVEKLELRGNPFEHYTAETEPDIAQYAVRPPYLQAIIDRARGLSSFILFGDRGAGKSATRITVYNAAWARVADSKGFREPFVVNLTDYTRVLENLRKDKLNERDLVFAVAFVVVEQILVWLSSLDEGEREVFTEGLNREERTLVIVMIRAFYLSISEMDREISTSESLKLLNSAWTTKSTVWAQQRWSALSKVVASLANAFGKKIVDESIDISAPAEALLASLTGEGPSAPRAILGKLVEFVQAFGFSGVSVLVDKLDETPITSNSAEWTAKLVYPLLAHIQLMEVPGFSWILFVWAKVKEHFSQRYPVRLDKLAHANITWNSASLREMLEARVRFYSEGRLSLADLFEPSVELDKAFDNLRVTAINSPRELIKLMDTLLREHDAKGIAGLIDTASLDLALDKFSVETIGNWFADKPLQQVLRLGRTAFINRDVQAAFKIGDQGARVKITKWEDTGLVVQNGTVPSDLGSKPSYKYEIADPRVFRIIDRKLLDVVGAEIEDLDLADE